MIETGLKKRARRTCGLLLILAVLCSVLAPGLSASAAATPTSLGLTQHGMNAYREGWVYVSGAKGSSYGGTRASDCAGLIYAYYADCGATSGLGGGATSQVTMNTVFSNDISEGIPRIHGLALTKPDYYDPYTGIYGHIGIYIGNNEAVDNSSYGVNMLWGPVVGSSRGWTAWHVFDQGTLYPVNGWYPLDGKYVHYTNFEYDVNTVIDGISIGSDGYAQGPVDGSLLSSQWVTADQVAAYLGTRYSGHDSTQELVDGRQPAVTPDPDVPVWEDDVYNGQVTGDGVNLRAQANTSSARVTLLGKGARLRILDTVSGELVTGRDGRSSDQWYQVSTAGGANGYISTLYAERTSTETAAEGDGTPTITAAGGYVTISSRWSGADIYYTTDGTDPNPGSNIYTGPLYMTGYTYKALAVYGGKATSVATATVLSNSAVFTDVTTKDWFYPAVDYAVSQGLFSGTGAGSFSPTATMSRGMFVTVLGKLAGVNTGNWQIPTRFTDVPATAYYAPYVAWAAEQGLVNGTSTTTFSPNSPVTREQIAVILYNFARRTGNDVTFSPDRFATFADSASTSAYAVEALQWAVDKHVYNGSSGLLNPRSTASRAEVATIFRTCQDVLIRTQLLEAEPITVSQVADVDMVTLAQQSSASGDLDWLYVD